MFLNIILDFSNILIPSFPIVLLAQRRLPRPEETQQLHGFGSDSGHLRQTEGQAHAQQLDPGPVHPDGGGQPRTPVHQDGGLCGGGRGELRGKTPLLPWIPPVRLATGTGVSFKAGFTSSPGFR